MKCARFTYHFFSFINRLCTFCTLWPAAELQRHSKINFLKTLTLPSEILRRAWCIFVSFASVIKSFELEVKHEVVFSSKLGIDVGTRRAPYQRRVLYMSPLYQVLKSIFGNVKSQTNFTFDCGFAEIFAMLNHFCPFRFIRAFSVLNN